MTQQAVDGKVMHFTCDHCKIALTVDKALVGVTGPCPSCGESITAPMPPEPKPVAAEPKPVSVEPKPVAPALPAQSIKESSTPEIKDRVRVEFRREILPKTAISEVNRERAEVTTVAKMLVAGLVVFIIVLGVTYLLKQ